LLELSHTTNTFLSSQPLQHLPEPDSVNLKMEAVHSSKPLENTSTTQHRHSKGDQLINTCHGKLKT
jgi:hypothetical protein